MSRQPTPTLTSKEQMYGPSSRFGEPEALPKIGLSTPSVQTFGIPQRIWKNQDLASSDNLLNHSSGRPVHVFVSVWESWMLKPILQTLTIFSFMIFVDDACHYWAPKPLILPPALSADIINGCSCIYEKIQHFSNPNTSWKSPQNLHHLDAIIPITGCVNPQYFSS